MPTSRSSPPPKRTPAPPGDRGKRSTSSADTSAPPVAPIPHLRPTTTPGVFLNPAGLMVDERGVLLSWARATETEAATAERILGHPITTPAQVLKRYALDPTMPLSVRLDAAKAAAPYYDMRMPLRVEGDMRNTSNLDPAKLAAMPRTDRETLLTLLRKCGAEL